MIWHTCQNLHFKIFFLYIWTSPRSQWVNVGFLYCLIFKVGFPTPITLCIYIESGPMMHWRIIIICRVYHRDIQNNWEFIRTVTPRLHQIINPVISIIILFSCYPDHLVMKMTSKETAIRRMNEQYRPYQYFLTNVCRKLKLASHFSTHRCWKLKSKEKLKKMIMIGNGSSPEKDRDNSHKTSGGPRVTSGSQVESHREKQEIQRKLKRWTEREG